MRGTVIRGNEESVLIRTDRGSTVVVEINYPFSGVLASVEDKKDDYPTLRELLGNHCDREWKRIEGEDGNSGGVPVIQGDKISYQKTGPGQYVVRKIFCEDSDPRAGSKSVQVVS